MVCMLSLPFCVNFLRYLSNLNEQNQALSSGEFSGEGFLKDGFLEFVE